MTETTRLPPIPNELTSTDYDPTTKIEQTPDGRVVVHSTRAGVESRVEFGGDGSFQYTSNTGTSVNFAANNQMEYHKGGFTLTVDNNYDIKITGSGRVSFDQDAHIEVAKNASIAVNGMADIYSTGHVKFTAADIYLGATKGSVVINAARDIELTASQGRLSAQTSAVMSFVTTSGDFHVAAAGEVDLNSGMNTNIVSQGSVITQSSGGTKLEGGGTSGPPVTITPGGSAGS